MDSTKIQKKDVPLRPFVNCIASPTYALAKYPAGLLGPFVRQSDHHIKNSEAFVQNLQSINLQETDILASFDVVSLFTKVLTSTYFLYDGSFYDQKNGVAMGIPLAPIVANLYMEHSEHQT
jgi:hypothetical protein